MQTVGSHRIDCTTFTQQQHSNIPIMDVLKERKKIINMGQLHETQPSAPQIQLIHAASIPSRDSRDSILTT